MSKTDKMTRIEKMEADGAMPHLPPVDGGGYLVTHLMDVGPVLYSGMGPTPLTYTELQAWQEQTGVELLPWEVRLLRSLSKAYAAESSTATAADAKAPYVREFDEAARAAVSSQARSLFGALARRKD